MKKKNISLVVLVIILSLLVIGLGGFIVYDKLLSGDSDKCVDNAISNENVNNDSQTEQENIGFIKPEEHVEIEESIKPKLIEVFEFVYGYNNAKFYGHYCVGETDENDKINPPSASVSWHKYNIASKEFSSFKEMMDYLKKYMTTNIIYNDQYMTIDNFIEKDGKLYCPYFATGKGSVYSFKEAKIKYSKPWNNGFYVTMETTLVTDLGSGSSMNEIFDVTFENKNNNWIISSYKRVN